MVNFKHSLDRATAAVYVRETARFIAKSEDNKGDVFKKGNASTALTEHANERPTALIGKSNKVSQRHDYWKNNY